MTALSCPSSVISTELGVNVAPVQTVPLGVAALGSPNVTTVPSGRSCGPSTAVPSAATVTVPAAVVDPSRKYSTSNCVSAPSGRSVASMPDSAFESENPPSCPPATSRVEWSP